MPFLVQRLEKRGAVPGKKGGQQGPFNLLHNLRGSGRWLRLFCLALTLSSTQHFFCQYVCWRRHNLGLFWYDDHDGLVTLFFLDLLDECLPIRLVILGGPLQSACLVSGRVWPPRCTAKRSSASCIQGLCFCTV